MNTTIDLKRDIGIFSCTMLVAGNMIGIGIFITAGRIYNQLGNPSTILLVWLLGGFLSLAGSLSYAELATRYPKAGGGYIYLKEAFGPFLGFLAGFSSSMVSVPGTTAFLAIGFTKYVGITNVFTAKSIALFLILSFSLINYWGVKWGAKLQDGFMVLKLFLIFILIVAGFLSGRGSFNHFMVTKDVPLSLWTAIPLAMIPVMYTYSGWDSTVYVAGEIKNPRTTIPISLLIGTCLVTLIYIALAAFYIYALPVTSPENQTRIVTAASVSLFGQTIGNVIGGLVAVSVLGCLAATILTGPRVIYAMAKDGLFPSAAGEIHPIFASPSKAILFQAVWSAILVVTGKFDQLLDYVTVPYMFFTAFAVLGLMKIRTKEDGDQKNISYKTWGYPVIPVLFIVGMFYIVVSTVVKSPMDSLWGLFIVSLGAPIYFVWKNLLSPCVIHQPYSVFDEKELVVIPQELCRDGKIFKAHSSAVEAFRKMSLEAQKDHIDILVFSSHRTVELQESLFKEAENKHGKGKGILWLAPPGYSEHHTGYAFDLADKNRPETDDEPVFKETAASQWLLQNAHRFDFELSFPENNWQGIGYEPWHWRFMGDEKSRRIFHPDFLRRVSNLIKSFFNYMWLKGGKNG